MSAEATFAHSMLRDLVGNQHFKMTAVGHNRECMHIDNLTRRWQLYATVTLSMSALSEVSSFKKYD